MPSVKCCKGLAPAIRLHDTRHTYTTWLLAHGVSHQVAQTLLSHSSITMTLDLYST
ncbi:MAG TPA: tyrosine-type recombinase/integrase [Candidatus Tectomicrobia bacterium]